MATIHSFNGITREETAAFQPDKIQWNHLYIKHIFVDEHERYAKHLEGVIESTIKECLEHIENICHLLNGEVLLDKSGFTTIGKQLPKKPIKLLKGVDFLKKARGCSLKLQKVSKELAKKKLHKLDADSIKKVLIETAAIERSYQTLKDCYEDSIDRIRQCDIAISSFVQYQELLKDNIAKVTSIRSISERNIGNKIKKALKYHHSGEEWFTLGELQTIIQCDIEGTYWYRIKPGRFRTIIAKIIEDNDGNGILKGEKKGKISQDKYSTSLLNEIRVKMGNDIPTSGAVDILKFKNLDELCLFFDYILEKDSRGCKMALEIRDTRQSYDGQIPLSEYLLECKMDNKKRGGGPRHYYFTRIMIDDLWAIKNNEAVWKQFEVFKKNVSKDKRTSGDVELIPKEDIEPLEG